MNLEQKVQNILDKFGNLDITSGYRMIMLIDRSGPGKDRRHGKSTRKISKNKEEFMEILKEFVEARKGTERIYSCVNERDINKAIRIFKQNQLEADYYDEESRNSFYLDIKNRWLSCFMQPQARKTSYFLLDVDTKNKETLDNIKENLCKISANYIRYETENGFHFICPPFNPELLPGVEIKKDGLLLLVF